MPTEWGEGGARGWAPQQRQRADAPERANWRNLLPHGGAQRVVMLWASAVTNTVGELAQPVRGMMLALCLRDVCRIARARAT